MQVDFHHGVTYVVARLAGFSFKDASVIAYASQFVDDAVNEGKIYFSNEAIFEFIASAHKMLDYRNFEKLSNHYVWIPFHFLPGNQSDPKLKNIVPDFVQRAICRPNSVTAQEMVAHAIQNAGHPNALHRLGITMHVYADTWAHQGFAGISHHVNTVREICDPSGKLDMAMQKELKSFFGSDWFLRVRSFVESKFVNDFAPVGHGPVLSYPDRPYLRWQYRDWKNDLIIRDNPAEFLDAVDHMYIAMKRYREKNSCATVLPMHRKDRSKIQEILRDCNFESGDKRHRVWLEEIRHGSFSFGPETIKYDSTGPNSWQSQVFPQAATDNNLGSWIDRHEKRKIDFPDNFPFSDWKLFHDALECHRTTILNIILPLYGIVAA